MKWRNGLVEVLGPFSVANIVKFWRYCQMYGVLSATRLAIRRLQKPMGGPPVPMLPFSPAGTPNSESPVSANSKTVSVVIPTKNAAAYVAQLVDKLRAQQGIPQCEITFVDSGSTDDTLALAEREGVRVIQIAPDEFTHSFSRNKGADTTTADYLLFMVQDALPLTNLWLLEMITALETNKLATVSCAEYPRADCDLFYGFLIHSSYQSGADGDRVLAWNESCSSYRGLRANARISDVAALIRRDIFNDYRYRTAYAEDLDLGIRLIRDGHRLGFLQSTRVLHSHNRSSQYFFKRGYVDVRYLVEIFSNFVFPDVVNKTRLLRDILTVGNRLREIARELQTLRFPLPTKELTERLKTGSVSWQEEPRLAKDGLGSELGGDMRLLLEPYRRVPSEATMKANMIWPHVLDHCERMHEWICDIYEVADRKFAGDLVSGWEKMFALHSGTHMAYLYLTLQNRGELDESLIALDRAMTVGV
jgi:glycosyltransferase involved in cell wall biosynthesis